MVSTPSWFGLQQVVVIGLVSSLVWLTSPWGAGAHEVRPAVADVTVGPETVHLEVRVTLEPLIAGIDLAGISSIDESPLSGLSDRLRALPPSELETAFRRAWPNLASGFVFEVAGARQNPEILSVTVPEVGDVTLPRDSRLVLAATLPEGTEPVRVGWSATFGPLVIRHARDGEASYAAMLNGGDMSDPLPRDAGAGGIGGWVRRWLDR